MQLNFPLSPHLADVWWVIPLFLMALGCRIPPPPPFWSGCWAGCYLARWGLPLLPDYPCSQNSWESNPAAPGRAGWETSGVGLLSLEKGESASFETTFALNLQRVMINRCPEFLLMQDRGSNTLGLDSLEPNLSSAPAPALLDPGYMYRKNKTIHLHITSSIS